jgi:two-component system, oxyanion-binding sensor
LSARLTPVIAGFIPLLDSAVLVVAAEQGFAEQEGIALKLVRETSWANIRDRIAVGHFDVAHMLAPMPIAATLNLTSLGVPMRAPMLLGLGGNAITVTCALWRKMAGAGADEYGDPASTGLALADVINAGKAVGKAPLRFGVVHPFSGHAYELRYWLAAADIDPDLEVEISVLAPQIMADALAEGQLDGYCVGEPWNTAAVIAGAGRVATYKQAIWPNSPEKVLGVTQKWANENPETLASLMRALSKAADWCSALENADLLAATLSRSDLLACSKSLCLPALTGNMQFDQRLITQIPKFLTFSGGVKAMPSPAQGKWFYEQMVRWQQANASAEAIKHVAEVYAPDLYGEALGLTLVLDARAPKLFDDTNH